MDAVAELLSDLAALLTERQIRWYLFGAQAVVLWGRPRLTADIDVTVAIEPEQSMALVAALEAAGFELRLRHDVAGFVARTRVLPFLHRQSGIQLDVVLAGPGLEERFLAGVRQVRIGETSIPVISPEHLVVTKLLAARPKDLEDVAGILATRHSELDLAEVRELLRLLEEALGQSDLSPSFEAALARAAGQER